MTNLTERLLDARAQFILDTFGGPDEWTDWQAIALCPVHRLAGAWGGAQYLVSQGRHATNVVEGLGCAIRRFHSEY